MHFCNDSSSAWNHFLDKCHLRTLNCFFLIRCISYIATSSQLIFVRLFMARAKILLHLALLCFSTLKNIFVVILQMHVHISYSIYMCSILRLFRLLKEVCILPFGTCLQHSKFFNCHSFMPICTFQTSIVSGIQG